MTFAKRAVTSAALSVSIALASACVEPPADDDAQEEEPGLRCCIVQRICANCVCDNSTKAIGQSKNEAACEAFLDDQENFGCDLSTISGMRYREVDAIADCSARAGGA